MTARPDRETPEERTAAQQQASHRLPEAVSADGRIFSELRARRRWNSGNPDVERFMLLPDMAYQVVRDVHNESPSREHIHGLLRDLGGEAIKVKGFFQTLVDGVRGVDSQSITSFVKDATKWVDDLIAWVCANIDGAVDLGTLTVLSHRMHSIAKRVETLLDLSRTSRSPTDVSNAEAEWSKPMSKATMMRALGIDSRKSFEAWMKDKEIRSAGNRQTWTIRLDTLDRRSRTKLEKV